MVHLLQFSFFFLLINGSNSGFSQNCSDWRKGRSLSLFIYVSNGDLSCVFKSAKEEGFLSGFKVESRFAW